MQSLFQSAQHIYEKREGSRAGSGSVPLTTGSGRRKTCGSCGFRSGSGSPTLAPTNKTLHRLRRKFGCGLSRLGFAEAAFPPEPQHGCCGSRSVEPLRHARTWPHRTGRYHYGSLLLEAVTQDKAGRYSAPATRGRRDGTALFRSPHQP